MESCPTCCISCLIPCITLMTTNMNVGMLAIIARLYPICQRLRQSMNRLVLWAYPSSQCSMASCNAVKGKCHGHIPRPKHSQAPLMHVQAPQVSNEHRHMFCKGSSRRNRDAKGPESTKSQSFCSVDKKHNCCRGKSSSCIRDIARCAICVEPKFQRRRSMPIRTCRSCCNGTVMPFNNTLKGQTRAQIKIKELLCQTPHFTARNIN